MSREDAVAVLQHLINSGILDSSLEEKIIEITKSICADNFENCKGTAYCTNCKFKRKE